jgi:hypothetical protein
VAPNTAQEGGCNSGQELVGEAAVLFDDEVCS